MKINKLINKVANELCWEENDWISEIQNHDIMYNQNTSKVIDDYGYSKFEDKVLNKIMKIRNAYYSNFVKKNK